MLEYNVPQNSLWGIWWWQQNINKPIKDARAPGGGNTAPLWARWTDRKNVSP